MLKCSERKSVVAVLPAIFVLLRCADTVLICLAKRGPSHFVLHGNPRKTKQVCKFQRSGYELRGPRRRELPRPSRSRLLARPTRSETISLLGLGPLLAHALPACLSPCPPSKHYYSRFLAR
jgi:hypothetical protein